MCARRFRNWNFLSPNFQSSIVSIWFTLPVVFSCIEALWAKAWQLMRKRRHRNGKSNSLLLCAHSRCLRGIEMFRKREICKFLKHFFVVGRIVVTWIFSIVVAKSNRTERGQTPGINARLCILLLAGCFFQEARLSQSARGFIKVGVFVNKRYGFNVEKKNFSRDFAIKICCGFRSKKAGCEFNHLYSANRVQTVSLCHFVKPHQI